MQFRLENGHETDDSNPSNKKQEHNLRHRVCLIMLLSSYVSHLVASGPNFTTSGLNRWISKYSRLVFCALWCVEVSVSTVQVAITVAS